MTEGTVATLAAKSATNTIPIVIRPPATLSVWVWSRASHAPAAISPAILGWPGGRRQVPYAAARVATFGQRMGVFEFSQPLLSRTREISSRRVGRCVSIRFSPELPRPLSSRVRSQKQFGSAPKRSSCTASTIFFENRVEIARAALRHSLPTLVQGKKFLEAGGLISYTFELGRATTPRCCLHRQDSARRKTSRSPDRAADEIRVGDQSEDRKGTRNHRSAVAAVARRRGDSVNRRRALPARTWGGSPDCRRLACTGAAAAEGAAVGMLILRYATGTHGRCRPALVRQRLLESVKITGADHPNSKIAMRTETHNA